MSEAGGPYRIATATPTYICVACFACCAAAEGTCASCGTKMRSLAEQDVRAFVMEEAARRVMVVAKRQALFGAVFAFPLLLYLVFLSSVGKTLSFLLPGLLWVGLVGLHPYLFEKDARIGRKYRAAPKELSAALDVLGTRIQ